RRQDEDEEEEASRQQDSGSRKDAEKPTAQTELNQIKVNGTRQHKHKEPASPASDGNPAQDGPSAEVASPDAGLRKFKAVQHEIQCASKPIKPNQGLRRCRLLCATAWQISSQQPPGVKGNGLPCLDAHGRPQYHTCKY